MSDIDIMKNLLSLVDEETINEAMPSKRKAELIKQFMELNPTASIDDVIKQFSELSPSSVKTVFNRITKATQAAANVKKAGSATSAVGKLTQWAKNNPEATIAGTAAGGLAVGKGMQSDKADDGTSAQAAPVVEPSTTQPSSTSDAQPTPSQPKPVQPAASEKPPVPANTAISTAGLTKQEEMELHSLAFDLEKMQQNDPNIAKLLEPYYKKYGKD